MPRVFITQENPRHDVIPAMDYGELIALFPAGRRVVLNSPAVVQELKNKLDHYGFEDDDFIIASGDPAIMTAVAAYAAQKNKGRYKLLVWDGRKEMRYFPVQVDLAA
jgi:hypothetical protein